MTALVTWSNGSTGSDPRCDDGAVPDPRAAFLDASGAATRLLGRPEVGERWNEPSALPELSVGELAGHLLRGILTVETYLDADEPAEGALDAAGYYHALNLTTDLADDLNRSVRVRSAEAARGGWRAVADEAESLRRRLQGRLGEERSDRRVAVALGLRMSLDEYLVTRVVELVVHTDDLATSVDLSEEFVPTSEASAVTIETLVAVARLRHGDLAVIRSLVRRERDRFEALRVL